MESNGRDYWQISSTALGLVAGLVMWVAAIYRYLSLPKGSVIPIHWDAVGNPNGFAPAAVGLFIIPFGMVASSVLIAMRKSTPSPRREGLIATTVYILLTIAQTIILMAAK